jgi:hypothetical protein
VPLASLKSVMLGRRWAPAADGAPEVVRGVVTISRGGIRTLHPRGLSVTIAALTGRQNNVADTTILDGAINPGHSAFGCLCSGIRCRSAASSAWPWGGDV